jgi:hypothetical protein
MIEEDDNHWQKYGVVDDEHEINRDGQINGAMIDDEQSWHNILTR